MHGSWTDYFDAIYCINLKERKDRKKRVKQEMQKAGIYTKIVFFNAIKVQRNGHIGCLESHRKIIQIAKKNKYKNILVLEDDAKLIDENINFLKDAISELKLKKWSMFYLGCTFLWKDFPYLEEANSLYQIHGARSSHAIAYNSSFFQDFLNITKSIDIIEKYGAFDVFLSLFGQEIFTAYMPKRPIFKQENSFSSIENKIINLDEFIVTNFNILSRRNYFKNTIIKTVRIISLIIWKITDGEINIFFNIYSLLHNFPKKILYKFTPKK